MSRKTTSKAQKIFYFIDRIELDEDKRSTKVYGWAFNDKTKKAVDLALSENEFINYKRIRRSDVNEKYFLPNNARVGFIISFDERFYHKKVTLKLASGNVSKSIKINLTKNYDYLKQINYFNIKRIGNSSVRFFSYLKKNGLKKTLKKIKYELKYKNLGAYYFWIDTNEKYDDRVVSREIQKFENNPKISIVVPVYNVDQNWLEACINSVINQRYTNWELCLADDCSPLPHVREVLDKYQKMDERIKTYFCEKNGHISEATNAAISIANGDYIGFMDNDDELSPFALYEYVKIINHHQDADFIYCDEDKMDVDGNRFEPFFKPDWNHELLMSSNYITHFVMVKKTLLDEVGLLKTEMNGSQDYDFILRATEMANGIYHIPKVLYHWRTIEESVAFNPEAKSYAYLAGKRALEDSLKRVKREGQVQIGENYGTYRVYYSYKNEPLVSIIILSNDRIKTLKSIDSVISNTSYPNYEIIVFGDLTEEDYRNDKIIFCNNENLNSSSTKKNYAVQKSKGEYLVFINNDVEIINRNWLVELLNYRDHENIGIVGGKLLKASYVKNEDRQIEKKERHFKSFTSNYFYIDISQNTSLLEDEIILIKKSLFNEINGFNENLVFPLSLYDLCFKTIQKNYKLIWSPYAKMRQWSNEKEKYDDAQYKYFEELWKVELEKNIEASERFNRF